MPEPILIGVGEDGKPVNVDPQLGGVLMIGVTGFGKTFTARLILSKLIEILEREGLGYASLILDCFGEYRDFEGRVAPPGVVPMCEEDPPYRVFENRARSALWDLLSDPSPFKVVVLDGVLNRVRALVELAATLLLKPEIFAVITLQTLCALHPSQAALLADAPHKLLFRGYDYRSLPPDLRSALGLDDELIPMLSGLGSGEALLITRQRRALVRIG